MAIRKALSAILYAALVTMAVSVDIGNFSQINVNDIQQQLPAELANTNLTLDDAKTLLKDKCIDIAGEEKGKAAFHELETSFITLSECISGILNYSAIQLEIEKASPQGELDVVFNKYCTKRPQMVECIEGFNNKLVPCLDAEERENQDTFMRIIRSLLSFICHKGGDQIALFIAEKGPECFESKKDDIQQCLNNTFSEYVPKDGLENIKTLPKLVMGEKQCNDLEHLETCVIEKLETCAEITPANIVESMFRFIKNETICRNTPSSAKQARINSATSSMSVNVTGLALIFVIFLTIFERYYV